MAKKPLCILENADPIVESVGHTTLFWSMSARAWARIQPTVLTAVAGGVIALVLLQFIHSARDLVVIFLQFIIAASVSVVIHELGHAVAARLAGLRLLMFAVWPVKLVRIEKSWQIQGIGRTRVSGFVAADPVGCNNLSKRVAIFVMGGPAASFLLGAAAAWMAYARPTTDVVATQATAIAMMSLALAVFNLIPGSTTDGGRLRAIRKGGAESERFCALLLLAAASMSGVRPRDLNTDLVKLLPGPLDGSVDSWTAQLIRYNWLIDHGSVDEAKTVLATVLEEKLPPATKDALQVLAAWLEAYFFKDLAQARCRLAASPVRSDGGEDYQCTLAAARGAVALLEGRWKDAELSTAEALRRCERIADSGAAKVTREALERMQNEIASTSSNRANI